MIVVGLLVAMIASICYMSGFGTLFFSVPVEILLPLWVYGVGYSK